MPEIDKSHLNEAILLLSKAYNNPTAKDIEQAEALLRKAVAFQSALPVAERADRLPTEKRHFMKSGVKWFDRWLGGGVCLQEFVLFGAIPHAGKTHLLSWVGGQFLLEGEEVVYFIGEDLRCDIRDNFERLVGANKRCLRNLWLVDMGSSRFGVDESEQVLLNLQKELKHKPRIVIFDHVDLMTEDQDWKAISMVLKNIKSLAKRMNMVFFSASQSNFGKEQRGMQRLYGAKVAKAGNPDIVIMVDDVVEDEYDVTLNKARGRRVRAEDRKKTLICNWDTMQIEEAR